MNTLSACLSKKQVFLYLLRGSLGYIFSGLLIWIQYVKRGCRKECVFVRKFLVYHGEMKGSKNFFS